MLATFTIEPCDSLRCFSHARVTWNRPRTLTANTRSQSSAWTPSRSSGPTSVVVPALFTRTSSRP